MDSLVSIIIPVFNHEEALKKALISIHSQTYRPLEVIIVDDGSEPHVSRERLGVRTDFELAVFFEDNKGAPTARNRGLQESKGEYVIFWDADVTAKKDMLEKMVETLTEHPKASYCYSNFYFGKKKMPARAFDPDALKKLNYIHSTSLIRRRDVVTWDQSLQRFQDWDLWLTMLEQGKKGVWIDEYLFTAEPRRGGISAWLPSFAYQKPWRWLPWIRGKVKRYEAARDVIMKKHNLK